MRDLETDYLVVGAGASGMAFVDTLIASSDADVVMVDRRHRPGGHWLDAYPFVRLHMPSANYGVPSRRLGDDRIDDSGLNAGFYERATAAEVCSYFTDVLERVFVPSGHVRFFPMCDYRGADAEGHHVVSLLSGAETTIKVRRRLVDATYVESTIPSRHTPAFTVDDGVRLIPPNDLVDLAAVPAGFTIIGCGKTAMDTCNWLLDSGLDPDRIQWIRPRDPWLFNRAYMQPLELVGAYVQLQARWVEAAAVAEDGVDFARRLESDDVLLRIDRAIEPTAFRGATISAHEIGALRSIENVVQAGKVLGIGTGGVRLQDANIPTDGDRLYVDCTAAGVRATVPRPVFEPGRITIQYVTIGIVPWGSATVGAVEALRDDDADKNRLCPPLVFTGNIADTLDIAYAGMTGLFARRLSPTSLPGTTAVASTPPGGLWRAQMIRRSQPRSWRWAALLGPPWRTWPGRAACRAPPCPNPAYWYGWSRRRRSTRHGKLHSIGTEGRSSWIGMPTRSGARRRVPTSLDPATYFATAGGVQRAQVNGLYGIFGARGLTRGVTTPRRAPDAAPPCPALAGTSVRSGCGRTSAPGPTGTGPGGHRSCPSRTPTVRGPVASVAERRKPTPESPRRC